MIDASKTVFISYRRDTSRFLARAIFEHLRAHRYDVFLDVESIDSGEFERVILGQIAARAHVIVLLTTGSLRRCVEPNDWLRLEIEYAMKMQRNVVPILVDEFSFKAEQEYLVGEMQALIKYNALKLYYDYFDEGMERLRTRYLKQPLYGQIVVTPPSDAQVVQQVIDATASIPAPNKQELNAEEYFNHGLKCHSEYDLDGEIVNYTEALRLNPDFVAAYYARGLAYYNKGDFTRAVLDYDETIRLKPSVRDNYNNRAGALKAKGDPVSLQAAIKDYNKVIEKGLNDSFAIRNRADVYFRIGDYASALADFQRAHEIAPDNKLNKLGITLVKHRLGEIDEAIRLWKTLFQASENLYAIELLREDLQSEALIEEARKLIARL